MSRRSIWQSMRMEVRGRGSDVETTPISQNASNNDSELGLLRSGSARGKEESGEATVEKKSNPTSAKKSKTHNTHDYTNANNNNNTNNNNNNDDDEQNDHTAVRRLHSLENPTKVPIVTLVDVPTVVTSTGKSVPSEVTTVVASPSTSAEVPVREKKSLMQEEPMNRDHTGRDSSTMRHDDIYMSLQVELAQEKKKNIDAEQRLLTLEKEVRVLRVENMRLASSVGTTEDVVDVKKKNTPDRFPISDGGNTHTSSENYHNNNNSPLEQMVKELQDELRMVKEYTKELESRLAVKSSALEQRTREVEQKENRIRQLERTIADELIWRTKEEHTHHALEEGSNSSGRVTPRIIQRPTNTTNTNMNINTNTTSEGGILTSTVGVAAPAVVRVPVERVRSQSQQQSQQEQQQSQTQQQTLKSHYAQERQSPPQRRPSSVRQSRAPSSTRVVVQPKEELKEKERRMTATPRRGSSTGRSSSTATAHLTAVRVRRKESTEPTPNTSTTTTITTVPSRTASATRKKSMSKPTHPTRRAATHAKRISASPTPYVALFDDPLRDDIASRRPGKRPPTTLDASTASVSLLSSHKGTTAAPLLNVDVRSIASTARSRPRIHHDADGITTTTTMRSSTTTVVTRSVKRRESPSLVPPPRADYVEERPSEQPFVSEKFSTTTYRPNRLVRYCKSGESEVRSDS
ncbi:hypothetical protein LSM04_003735 [Trypanosoma melophagium]|uniref:uncharacterized protein n=1 Tax=Trypanosoma melophagium TaxID=715481 RepID=UPI00351A969A|nr:hypothetical protein LSM04_003735 [Trypanosoma melophagium]